MEFVALYLNGEEEANLLPLLPLLTRWLPARYRCYLQGDVYGYLSAYDSLLTGKSLGERAFCYAHRLNAALTIHRLR